MRRPSGPLHLDSATLPPTALPSRLIKRRTAAKSGLRVHPRRVDPPDQRTLPLPAPARTRRTGNAFQRHLSTLVVYFVALVVAIVICAVGYTAYAFSEFRGVILPGVYVSNLSLSGMSPSEGEIAIQEQLSAIHQTPVEFVAGKQVWKPSLSTLGIQPDWLTTATNAYSIGRSGDFFQNLIDRLPIRRHFDISLVYTPRNSPLWSQWITTNLSDSLDRQPVNAWLTMSDHHAVVITGLDGRHVDGSAALNDLRNNLGSLYTHRIPVPMVVDQPLISNASAAATAQKINTFLSNPPVLLIGTHHVHLDPVQLASCIWFPSRPVGTAVTIPPEIRWHALKSYLYRVIGAFNRPVVEPTATYSADHVSFIQGKNGFRYAGDRAYTQFSAQLRLFQPGKTIRVKGHVVKPPLIPGSPASYGIDAALGEGVISLNGSPAFRLAQVQQIAAQLNDVLIKPGAVISFNAYVNQGPQGTGWPPADYVDNGRVLPSGLIVEGAGGAMDQVATAFFRAGFAAGLQVDRRSAPRYLLPWYTPPGMDAAVTPTQDLTFTNDTGGWLLLGTRYEPVQQKLYIYVYGKKSTATVAISAPKRTATIAPGAPITKPDPDLAPGARELETPAFPGYDYVVTRTITGGATAGTYTLVSDYQPRPAVYQVGVTSRPTPTPTPTPAPVATPTAVATPIPSPTP